MKKISSKLTVFHKKVFPVLWFGFLGVFVAFVITRGAAKTSPIALVAPLAMAAFGYFLMRRLVWDLVDEVYDGGEFLLVKNRGEEERISLSEIMNIDSVTMMNPPRITLRLNRSSRFGSEIAFSPVKPFTLNPFAKNEIAENLIARVDRARSKGGV